MNAEYQKEISNIIRRLKDKQPDLKGLVSVTETDVAPDLKTAYVYVSIYASSEEEKATSFQILQESAGFIRHELAKVMQMRTVPALTFRMDGSMTYGAKMDELFKKLHENDTKKDEEQ